MFSVATYLKDVRKFSGSNVLAYTNGTNTFTTVASVTVSTPRVNAFYLVTLEPTDTAPLTVAGVISCAFQSNASGTCSAKFRFRRGGATLLGEMAMGGAIFPTNNHQIFYPCSNLQIVDLPGTTTGFTYSLEAQVLANFGQVAVNDVRLIALEIPWDLNQ